MNWRLKDIKKFERRSIKRLPHRPLAKLWQLFSLINKLESIPTDSIVWHYETYVEIVKTMDLIWINGNDSDIEDMERIWTASRLPKEKNTEDTSLQNTTVDKLERQLLLFAPDARTI